MRRIVFIAVLAVSPLVFAKGQDIDKVNGAIRTEAGIEYGDLDTVNGSISVARGVIAQSASTVNGGVDIEDEAVVGSVETVNGGVSIGQQAQIEEDVSTVNGAIEVARGTRVHGQVETVNGRISLDAAEVGRGLATVNGDITVGADSIVRGGIKVEKPRGMSWGKSRKPRVVIGPNATVEGTLDFEREVELYVHTTARIGTVRGATAVSFSGDEP